VVVNVLVVRLKLVADEMQVVAAAGVHGEPIGNVTVVTRNAAGQTQHIVGNYRPQSTLLLLSRRINEHFAGTPYGDYFLASEP